MLYFELYSIIMYFIEVNIIILYNINMILIKSEAYFNMYVKGFFKMFSGCFHKEKNLMKSNIQCKIIRK